MKTAAFAIALLIGTAAAAQTAGTGQDATTDDTTMSTGTTMSTDTMATDTTTTTDTTMSTGTTMSHGTTMSTGTTMSNGTTMSTGTTTAAATDSTAWSGTATASAGQVVQPGNTAPERDARGIRVLSDAAMVPAGWNGSMGTAGTGGPLLDPSGQPADASYPACTAAVTDNCVQTYERNRR